MKSFKDIKVTIAEGEILGVMAPRNLLLIQQAGGKSIKVTAQIYEPSLKSNIGCVQHFARQVDADAAADRLRARGATDVHVS